MLEPGYIVLAKGNRNFDVWVRSTRFSSTGWSLQPNGAHRFFLGCIFIISVIGDPIRVSASLDENFLRKEYEVFIVHGDFAGRAFIRICEHP